MEKGARAPYGARKARAGTLSTNDIDRANTNELLSSEIICS